MGYNDFMLEIAVGTNEKGQRLDRFLRKYLSGAPLSYIYKVIRKDVKVNGKRSRNEYMLSEGDVVTLYLSEETIEKFKRRPSGGTSKKTFRVAYEDERVLIADKPAGLLTHGDMREKSEHLANQVQGYLRDKGEYDPGKGSTFAPSPVNRLDRNTSGLVIFAKDYDTLKNMNRALRERTFIHKYYIALAKGEIEDEVTLSGNIEKDEARNISRVDVSSPEAKDIVTRVKPVKTGTFDGAGLFTLIEVELETGRTHQIRAQLAAAGHPLVGDRKYGDEEVNRYFREKYGLNGQLLTAYKLAFDDKGEEWAEGLSGKTVTAKLPGLFDRIIKRLEQEER